MTLMGVFGHLTSAVDLLYFVVIITLIRYCAQNTQNLLNTLVALMAKWLDM